MFVFSTRNSYLLINEHYLLVIQPLVFLTAAIPAALVAINVSEHRPMERRVPAWVGTHVRAAKRRHGGRFFESTTHIRKKVFTTLHCNRRPFQSLAHPVPKSSPYPPFQTKPGGGLTLELDGNVHYSSLKRVVLCAFTVDIWWLPSVRHSGWRSRMRARQPDSFNDCRYGTCLS